MVLQKKRPPLWITLGAVLLFVGGGALAFWATNRRSAWVKALPAGANAIPADAVMVVALSTDEGQWRRLRQFGTPATQEQFDQVLAQWRDRLFTQAGLSFGTDLQPWVGPEITLALLPAMDNSGAGNSTLPVPLDSWSANLVAVVPIGNISEAQAGLGNRLVEAQGVGDNPYRGITIQQLEGQPDPPLYTAVLNSQLALVSAQLPLLKKSIDAFRNSQSVADRPGFSKAFEQLGETRSLARLYLDVPTVVQALANTADPPIPSNRLEALRAPRALVGSLLLQNQGLHLQAISWLDQGSQVFNTSNKADQMPQRFPANTLIMASTGDFQQFWEDFKTGKQWLALTPIRPEEITLALQSATGLVLEEDLLPWMGGEFALGVLSPPPTANRPETDPVLPNPALALMVKTNDREAATATLNRLDEVMTNRYRFTVEQADLGGVPVTRWTAPFASLSLAYGWLPGDVVFLTVGNGVEGLIAPRPNRSLAEASAFQTTTGQAPRPNNGHFFIHLTDLAAAEDNLLLPPLPTKGLLSAEAIDAIGVTATVLSDRQVRYDITTALKRGNRPGPLPSGQPQGSEGKTVPPETTTAPPEAAE
ncbi:MAG TPA: DUF3352 domain-containing protein [Leptolyngbyaceae cyanobacterium M65_K2018_010]|nr:DUF3352 domain-containing protein [Leptolyngbyaceae cyanobacterium M65_K2018_010]